MSLFGVIRDAVTSTTWNIGANGGGDVNIQDQTTRAIINRMCRSLSAPYTLSASTVPGAYTIALTNATGIVAGDDIGLFQNSTAPASYFGRVLSVATNTLTMDTPVDSLFDIVGNSPVLFEIDCNMNKDGSGTPLEYAVTNDSGIPIDITRIMTHITDGSSMDDSKFGGVTSLTRGCVLRKHNADDTFVNYFNVKNNGEIGEICYDKAYDDKAPAGLYGFRSRLTFGGQSKIGVVIRLNEGERLEILIQDDLTGLASFNITAEGHYTDNV